MNLEVLKARHADTVAEMRSLVEEWSTRDEDFDDETQTRFDELETSATEDKELIDKLEERAKKVAKLRTGSESDGDFQVQRKNDPYDLSELRFGASAEDLRGRALKAIEVDEILPDDNKETATSRLRAIDRRGEFATMILFTGGKAYRTAFPKLASGNAWALTDDEKQAVLRAQAVSPDTAGGFAVPFTLDPTVVLTNDGAINPMRAIAQIRTTTTEDWNGVTSAGATANWRAEAAEATDDSIALAQPNIPVHKMDIFIPYSIEIDMDWAQMESEMRGVMVDAKDRLEATAHFTGTGTGQPTGVVVALTGTASEINPDTAETFAIGDVYKTRRLVPPRFRSTRDMPSWVANLGTYDQIRQFDTGGGGGFWTDMTDGTPDRLLGHRTYESSAMQDAADINPAATAQNRILIAGDFKQYYIVDRIGMRIENIPHLFGANQRPTGQRGFYGYLRTGGDVLVDNAFRMLNVVTAA